jgi:hypothetical protein
MSFDVTWNPNPAVLATEFDGFNRSIRSLKEPLDKIIRDVCIPTIKDQFSSEGIPGWKSLAEFTVDKKGHNRILWETGELEKQAAYIKNWTVRGPEGTATLDKLNPSVSYGYLHNSGFTNWVTGKPTPARIWAAFQDGDDAKAEEIIWEWLNDRATKELRMAIAGIG